MMKKSKFRLFSLKSFSALALSILLVSCGNGFLSSGAASSGSAKESSVQGTTGTVDGTVDGGEQGSKTSDQSAYILLNLNSLSGVARTIFPDQSNAQNVSNFSNFTLTGIRSEDLNSSDRLLLEAESVDDIKNQVVPIEPGTWTFTLRAELDGASFVGYGVKAESASGSGTSGSGTSGGTGTGSAGGTSGDTGSASSSDFPLPEPIIIKSASLTPVSFELAAAENFGGLEIKVIFPLDENVNCVRAILTSAEDDQPINENVYEKNGSELSFEEEKEGDKIIAYSVTYRHSLGQDRLAAGYYCLTFNFYPKDSDYANEEDIPLNSISYYIKVSPGFISRATQNVKLNQIYTIEYEYNGGTLDGVQYTKYSRKSGVIPLPHLKKEGYTFAGWYEEPDFTGENVVGLPSSITGNRFFYAAWIETAKGNTTFDNRALEISLNKTSLRNSAGNTIKFSVKDAKGKELSKTETDEMRYYAELLYQGREVNALREGCFYSVYNNILTLNERLPRFGKYQLYVVAFNRGSPNSYNIISSSQTFNISLTNDLPYMMYGDVDGVYKYYLVDDVEEYSSNRNPDYVDASCISDFDLDGNFYSICKDQNQGYYQYSVISEKHKESPAELSALQSFEENIYNNGELENIVGTVGISIDKVNNIFYAWGNKCNSEEESFGSDFDLFKYPDFISTDDFYTVVSYKFALDGYIPLKAVVNDGILYCLVKGANVNDFFMTTYDLKTIDVPDSNTALELEIPVLLTSGMTLSKYAEVRDMIFNDGCIYIILGENNIKGLNGSLTDDEITNFADYSLYSRGALIEFNPETNGVRSTGFTNDCISNSNMSLYLGADDCGPLYSESENFESYVPISPSVIIKDVKEGGEVGDLNGTSISRYFPKVYGTSSLDIPEDPQNAAFVGPQKIIGIKPKRLVVTDGGIFFYTHTDGGLRLKEVNRLVTVDLENFIIESIKTSSEYDFSEVLETDGEQSNVLKLFNFGWVGITSSQDSGDHMYIEGIYAYGYEDNNGGEWVPMTDSSASMFLYMLKEE
ncbi:MAG: InlB B-repeat-containing protein [Treponema sp.]|nr:InlB B-repeat-containing protein [Treponema sp.]